MVGDSNFPRAKKILLFLFNRRLPHTSKSSIFFSIIHLYNTSYSIRAPSSISFFCFNNTPKESHKDVGFAIFQSCKSSILLAEQVDELVANMRI